MKISLGCGKKEKEGWAGLDIQDFGWNKVWDAEKDPIPYPDNSADFIEAHNFLEHIHRGPGLQLLMNECHRVLKPNGIMEIIVPDAETAFTLAVQDITHVSFWIKGTFKYLSGERPRNADYGFRHWKILRLENGNEANTYDPRVIFAHLQPNK